MIWPCCSHQLVSFYKQAGKNSGIQQQQQQQQRQQIQLQLQTQSMNMYVINEAKYPLSTPTNTAQSPENPNHKQWRVASVQTSLPEATSDHQKWFTKCGVVCWENIYFHHDDHQISKKLKVLHWWFWFVFLREKTTMHVQTCFLIGDIRKKGVVLLKNWKSAQKAATTYEIKQSIRSDNVA